MYDTIILVLCVLGTIKAAEIIGKKIPDSATGWKANLRKICKLLSGYVENEK